MGEAGPSDPMWATFRERHPEVNLVLLPEQTGPDVTRPHPAASLADARTAAATLTRRVRLIGELMGVPHDPVAGWSRLAGGSYAPTVRLHGSAQPDAPSDPQVIAHRLSQLGWSAQVRPEPELVWIEGHAGDDFVRVTVVDGLVGVRARGGAVSLDEADAAALLGGEGG